MDRVTALPGGLESKKRKAAQMLAVCIESPGGKVTPVPGVAFQHFSKLSAPAGSEAITTLVTSKYLTMVSNCCMALDQGEDEAGPSPPPEDATQALDAHLLKHLSIMELHGLLEASVVLGVDWLALVVSRQLGKLQRANVLRYGLRESTQFGLLLLAGAVVLAAGMVVSSRIMGAALGAKPARSPSPWRKPWHSAPRTPKP